MLTFKHFNIADWFSFYRVMASPLLIVLILLEWRIFFAVLLTVSYLTDAIDGYLARKLRIISKRGSQLDSLGDQLTFIIGLSGLYFFEREFIRENITIILIAFSPYIIQMILAYFKYGKATAFHTYLAKISAVIQCIFILYALYFNPEYVLFYLMIGLGILETLEEISLIFMYRNWTSDVESIFWAIKDKKRNERNSINSNDDSSTI